MEKKLYRVKVVLYVMAENESAACVAATRARFDIFECTARKADRVEPEWKDAIPYNAEDERTCAMIMNKHQQPAYPAVKPVEMYKTYSIGLRTLKLDRQSIRPVSLN